MKVNIGCRLTIGYFSSLRAISSFQIERSYRLQGVVEKQVSARILRTNSQSQLLYMYSQLTRNIDYNAVHLVLLFGRLLEHEASRAGQAVSANTVSLIQQPMFYKLLNSLERSTPRLRPDFFAYFIRKLLCAAQLGIHIQGLLDALVEHLSTENNFNLLEDTPLLDTFGGLAQLSCASSKCTDLTRLLSHMQVVLLDRATEKRYAASQLLGLAKWMNLLEIEDRRAIERLNKQILLQKSANNRGLYSWYFLNRRVPKNGSALARILGLVLNRQAFEQWSVAQCSRFLMALSTESTRAETLLKTLEKCCVERLETLLGRQLKGEETIEGLHLLADYLLSSDKPVFVLNHILINMIAKNVPDKGEQYAFLLYLLKSKVEIEKELILRVIEDGKTSFLSLKTLLDLKDELTSWDDQLLEPIHKKIIKVFIKRSSDTSENFRDVFNRVAMLPWTHQRRLWLIDTVRKTLARFCLVSSERNIADKIAAEETVQKTFLQIAQIMRLLSEVVPNEENVRELSHLFAARMLSSGITEEAGEILLLTAEGNNRVLAAIAKSILIRASAINLG